MAKARIFIAIKLPSDVQAVVDKYRSDLAGRLPIAAVRWVAPENVHLTLRFLGDTDVDQLSEISQGLDRVAGRHKPFELKLGKLGCFPNARRPRVIWIGLHGDLTGLERLQGQIEGMLASLGWKPEGRPFHPHLTIGRVKDSQAAVRAGLDWGEPLEPIALPVTTVQVMESKLRPTGAVYSVRHASKLEG